MKLDIIVPCYNEEQVLPATALKLVAVVESSIAAGRIAPSSQVVFVDDGSRDRTWALICKLAERHSQIAGIKLSRNRGHQVALLAGMAESKADAVITIDADLQDDISVIAEMLDHCRKGVDVVFGVRRTRSSDSIFKRVTAGVYYWMLRRLGVDLVEQHADFRLLSRRALGRLMEYRESNLFLRGLIPQLGFPSERVYYDRAPRLAGETKYPLRRMLGLALDGVTSFSAAPLRLAAGLGALAFLVSFILSIWVFWTRFFTDSAVPGWASTVIPMYFLGGVQLLCLGVMGEYLARVFIEVKHRPRYFVERTVGRSAMDV